MFDFDIRVVVTGNLSSFEMLNCVAGTPVNTCQTAFAIVIPGHLVINYFDIIHGTYRYAGTTKATIFNINFKSPITEDSV